MAKTDSDIEVNFTVAITGHRSLEKIDQSDLKDKISQILFDIESQLIEFAASDIIRYNNSVSLELVSGLAIGADILAHQALDEMKKDDKKPRANWRQSAIFPQSVANYRDTLCDGIENINPQAAKAEFDSVFTLLDSFLVLGNENFDPKNPISDYNKNRRLKTVGQLLVRRADVLIAIWNGEPAQGMGGTADVVQEARRVGLPIVWIEPKTLKVRSITPSNPENVSNVIEIAQELKSTLTDENHAIDYAIKMAIPTDPNKDNHEGNVDETKHANRWNGMLTFLGANVAGHNEGKLAKTGLIFYELFLFLMLLFRRFPSEKGEKTGLLRKWTIRLTGIKTDYGQLEWDLVKNSEGIESPNTIGIVSHLKEPFVGADMIATRLGHVYRSSYVLIYTLAGLAVVFALAGLLWHDLKPLFVSIELVCIIILGAIFLFARQRQWHKRWINSRQISESLRGIRILTYLGVTGRRPTKPDENWVTQIINNYAAQPILENLTLTKEYQISAVKTIRNLLENQIGYHKNNHHRMAKLHHVLEKWSEIFVIMAFFVGVVFLIYHNFEDPINAYFDYQSSIADTHGGHHTQALGFKEWFFENINYIATFIGGVFPAVATIFVSIRFQGDFERFAERSEGTAKQLEGIVKRINDFLAAKEKQILTYERLLEIAYDAQEILEADLEDWRFVYAAKPTPGL